MSDISSHLQEAALTHFWTHEQAPDDEAKGKDIFSKNCFRCHGDNGLGDETSARIAGQQSDYLKLTLQRYKSGNGIRVDPPMAANTRLLSDGDLNAVVAYISALSTNAPK